MLLLELDGAAAVALARLVDRLAHGDLVQPRVELGGIPERARALDGDDRHLLRDVLGGRRVAEHAERRRAGDGERAGGEIGSRVGLRDRGAPERRRDHVGGVGLDMLHRRHGPHGMWREIDSHG